jgi:hypothetical protein
LPQKTHLKPNFPFSPNVAIKRKSKRVSSSQIANLQ